VKVHQLIAILCRRSPETEVFIRSGDTSQSTQRPLDHCETDWVYFGEDERASIVALVPKKAKPTKRGNW
jgi:hypothetical protein